MMFDIQKNTKIDTILINFLNDNNSNLDFSLSDSSIKINISEKNKLDAAYNEGLIYDEIDILNEQKFENCSLYKEFKRIFNI